jgi:hypothetical protein
MKLNEFSGEREKMGYVMKNIRECSFIIFSLQRILHTVQDKIYVALCEFCSIMNVTRVCFIMASVYTISLWHKYTTRFPHDIFNKSRLVSRVNEYEVHRDRKKNSTE